MPFGLKIVGATYQRVMNSMLHDFIETFMQVYIDDIVIKSVSHEFHLDHLWKSFERMRKHGLKMNPLKCAFFVQAGDFLGFVVHKKGIEINQNKTKAIMSGKLKPSPLSYASNKETSNGKKNINGRLIISRNI